MKSFIKWYRLLFVVDFLRYQFNKKVSISDKIERLKMFWHFLGYYHHKEGGEDVGGEGKASLLDILYLKRFGFKSAWNIAGNLLEEHKIQKHKKKSLEKLYNFKTERLN